MSLPPYAAARTLAREALRGEHLIALGQAREALGRGDAAGALTVVMRFRQRPGIPDEGHLTAPALAMRGSGLFLQALALRQLGREEETPELFSRAASLFDRASSLAPLDGCALAEHAATLVYVGRVGEAVEPAERAVLAGDMVPEDVLLQVTRSLCAAGAPERAERLLRKVIERCAASPALLQALLAVASPEDGRSVALALMESLLGSGRETEAVEVADRMVADAPAESRRSAEVLQAAVRLAAGAPSETAVDVDLAGCLEGEPAVVQLAALALAASGRVDVMSGSWPDDGAGGSYIARLMRAAAFLSAGRRRDAMAVLAEVDDDWITLRLRAAGHEALGEWAAAAEALRRVVETAPDDSEVIAALASLEARAGSSDALQRVESTLNRRPWDAVLLGARAAVLALLGRNDEAVEVAERALSMRPALERPRTALAQGLLAKDPRRGLDEAERVLADDPNNFEALFVKGNALNELGTTDESIAVLRRLEDVAPWHHAGMLLLAASLERTGDLDGAREVYAHMVAEHPRDPTPYVAAARLEWERWRLEPAKELLQKAMDLEPGHAEANAGMAEVCRRMGDVAGSERFLVTALEQQPDHPGWVGTLGQLRVAQGNLDEGVRLLRRATEADPGLAWAQFELGEALRSQGRLDEALSAYDAALRSGAEESWTRTGKAAALLQRGELDEALREASAALASSPDYALALGIAGYVHLQHDALSEAFAALDRAVELAPDDVWVRGTRAYAHWLAGSAPDQVLSDLRTSLDLAPGDVTYTVGLGYALLLAGDEPAALDAFTAAVGATGEENADRLAVVWAHLGLGHWEAAVSAASDLLLLGPRDLSAHLTYGVALLCVTSQDDLADLDVATFGQALQRVADEPDPRRRAHLLRSVDRDLRDLELVAGLRHDGAALDEAVAAARAAFVALDRRATSRSSGSETTHAARA